MHYPTSVLLSYSALLSHCLSVILSHCPRLSYCLCHTVPLSLHLTVPSTVLLSPCHTVSPLHCLTVCCLPVTLSHYHKATIGCKLVSHQEFPFSSMRVGGHYHYAIMTFNRKVTIKNITFANKPQHTKQSNSMTHLQVSSGCSKA